jgi:transcriptional regulator with XRE-family HTH domain
MRTLDQIIDSLPPERRAKVTARGQQLVLPEIALRHLRQAHELTQERMAELLHIRQASISRIENRSDMLLSTLRSYVEAMGGSLRLVAEFPDSIAELSSLGEALDIRQHRPPPTKHKTTKRRRPHLVHAE